MSDIDQSSDKCYYLSERIGDAMSTKEWITVKEAANRLNISERNVRYKIQSNQLKAKRNGKLWLVHSSLLPETADEAGNPDGIPTESGDFTEIIGILKSQLEEKDKQIAKLQEELSGRSERADTIIMSLSKKVEMLESSEQKSKRGWWSRLWKRENEKG